MSAMMSVHRTDAADTSVEIRAGDMASRYDKASDPQFTHGRELIDLLALRPRDRILDVGCGTGRLAAFAVDRLSGEGRIIGIDLEPSRIELAQTNRDERLEFRVGRAEDLSAFRAAEFDAVYMNSVVNWVDDKSRALGEAYRVLKPSGCFGLATTIRDRTNELWRIVRQARDRASALSPAEVAERAEKRQANRYLSLDEVRRLSAQAGFQNRIFELRTYVSTFRNLADVIEFLHASTDENMLSGSDEDYMTRFRTALEQTIVETIPEARRRSRIELDRYVLLAVADKPA
jgi:ubiquinone/menaquinone biosynthesis C-methylase UbiE